MDTEEMMYEEMKRIAGTIESLSIRALMPWEDLQNFLSLRGGAAGEVHDMRDEDPSYGHDLTLRTPQGWMAGQGREE
jgi:hypothetical protein